MSRPHCPAIFTPTAEKPDIPNNNEVIQNVDLDASISNAGHDDINIVNIEINELV